MRMALFHSRVGFAALGFSLSAAIVAGLQLTGVFGGEGEGDAVTDYLGQEGLSICVQSDPTINPDYEINPGSGADSPEAEATSQAFGTVPVDPVEISDEDLQQAVVDAIEYGRENFWQGSYLEDYPIDVAIGCPLEPVPADQAYVAPEPEARFSFYVFAIDREQAEALEIRPDTVGLPFVTIQGGPTVEDPTFITYATYIRDSEDLADVEGLASAIGSAYGRPVDSHDGVCDDPDQPRCFDPSATPPVLDHNAPSR